VKRIPPGYLSRVAATPRIVKPEALDADVPERTIMLEEEALGHGDPKRGDDEKSAEEILAAQVCRPIDGTDMLSDPIVKRCSQPVAAGNGSLPGTCRDGLADVDRIKGAGRLERGVRGEFPGVEQRVDTRSGESLLKREGIGSSPHQLLNDALGEVSVVEWIVIYVLNHERSLPHLFRTRSSLAHRDGGEKQRVGRENRQPRRSSPRPQPLPL